MSLDQQIDFHGWFLSDAATEIDRIVGAARLGKYSVQVTFITGIGKHKQQVLEMMEAYGIEANEMMGNPGCVVAHIE